MERKSYLMNVLIGALVMTIILAFVLPSNGQSLNTTGGQVALTELTAGNWVLSDRKTEMYNHANITKWSGIDQNLLAMCQWIDVLNIEHTISNGFKWEDVPTSMAPGKDFKFAVEYVNDEYSTPNRVLTGFNIRIDKMGEDYMNSSKNGFEVGRLVKDNKNYNSEKKTVFFTAPKTLLGETNQMQMMVDCFIGQDHYVTTYTYTWTGDGSASK